MNKKAEITSEELIKYILLAIVILLIVLPITIRLLNIFLGKPKSQTIDSRNLLLNHIKYMEKGSTEMVPLYIDDKHIIKGFPISSSNSQFAGCEKERSCICVCPIEGCAETTKKIDCRKVDYFIDSIKPDLNEFTLMPTERVNNFLVKMEQDNKITVEFKPGIGVQ